MEWQRSWHTGNQNTCGIEPLHEVRVQGQKQIKRKEIFMQEKNCQVSQARDRMHQKGYYIKWGVCMVCSQTIFFWLGRNVRLAEKTPEDIISWVIEVSPIIGLGHRFSLRNVYDECSINMGRSCSSGFVVRGQRMLPKNSPYLKRLLMIISIYRNYQSDFFYHINSSKRRWESHFQSQKKIKNLSCRSQLCG